jgi:hypothetical protein
MSSNMSTPMTRPTTTFYEGESVTNEDGT